MSNFEIENCTLDIIWKLEIVNWKFRSECNEEWSGSPYPEVTDANLPSSLTLVFPITLEYSSYPPVLVCGTVSTTPR